MTNGELALVAIIFGLIYAAGLLPKLVKALTGTEGPADGGPTAGVARERD
jgi:hypothetical protein